MERFLFQYFLYTTRKAPLAPSGKTVALVYTANVGEQDFAAWGMDRPIAATRSFVDRIFGGSKLFVYSDTKQVEDYSRYEMDYFDTSAKDKRHAEMFPRELRRAFDFGASLVKI